MEKISAVIITFNEEENIERCLKSLDFVDEIILVDSFSTDKTVEVAKKFNAKIFKRKFTTYGDQKNFGNEKSKNKMIFSIDADEEVSEKLKKAILEEAKKEDFKNFAYEISRKIYYLNGFLNHGGYYPEYKLRIFNRDFCRWDNKKLHEGLLFSKKIKVKKLKGDLYHYSYRNINDHLERIIRYSDLDRDGKFSYFKMFFSPPFRFFKSYILKLGFLDGMRGFIFATFSAYSIFIRYARRFEEKIKE